MIKTLPSNAQDAGSIPGQGAKIPHASRPTNQIQNKQYSNKFHKDFKNGPKKNLKKLSGRQRSMQENRKNVGDTGISRKMINISEKFENILYP